MTESVEVDIAQPNGATHKADPVNYERAPDDLAPREFRAGRLLFRVGRSAPGAKPVCFICVCKCCVCSW